MSVWKGSNLIAAAIPGQNGTNGTDGRNGDGIMIVKDFTELHNNINVNGSIEMRNQVVPASGESEPHAAWCEVGGYDNMIVGTGQATIVWGYGNTVSGGQSGAIFGYGNDINSIGQGTLITGYENRLTSAPQGTTLIGYSNAIVNDNNLKAGMFIQGHGHTKLYISQNGGVQLGYGLKGSATTAKPSMPKNTGIDSQVAMVVGVRLGSEGADSQHAIGLAVRGDGDVGVYGDIGFTAKDLSSGSTIGNYTLGSVVAKVNEIAQAMGLQPIPTNSNSLD